MIAQTLTVKPPPIGLHHNSKVACLATIPGREEECRQAVASLLPQMDAVVVVFNYKDTPPPLWVEEMSAANLYPVIADNHLGDGAKFAISEHLLGYQFICDDDLIYPPNYATWMIAKIEKYHRQAAIGLGGSVISGEVESYYQGRHKHGHALREWTHDTFTNVLVTCALGFHSSRIRFPLSEIRHANMADIFFARHCQANHIPMVCAAHGATFLGYPASMKGKWTICG